ncbi:uncharacterized protein [Zea mays]|nr:uncharacterized protein LOC100217101 isoform X2 [Zea mays]|eukprot:XP_020402753.1 uncharacterized protein LOC100217101 isoform X3 [Zea mays]
MAPAFPRRRPTSPDSPPHTAAAPMAHPPCSPPWPPGGGFGLPESPPNVSPPNQSEKSTGRSFCTSRTGEGRGARQHYVPAGRVSPGPMASAMSSRSRPAGHFGVFPVNAMAGTGGSDGGVQLADKLKIIKTDNFDPDAYVQSKCRAMDEKKMVVFVMQQAVWNVDTNNEAVQGFRRSLHDETRLSYMLSCGSLERLLNMRNLKLWMVRMTMMKTMMTRMMMIMIQRTRELLEGKGNRENDLQSASSSEQRRCALCKALELPLLQSLNLQR